jgi:two-component system, OmpR family, sensor histidine kinase BaeS
MRSLALKLTLAFLLVGLIGAVVVAIQVQLRTRRAFDNFVIDQYQSSLVSDLTQYYQQNGNWKGVEAVFLHEGGSLPVGPGQEAPWDERRVMFTIANSDGIVVIGGGPDSFGRELEPSVLNKGVPLKADGTTVGWLLSPTALARWSPATPEGGFLQDVNQAILWSALGATAIALVLGGVLAFTLTRSLRELTAATKELAGGKLGHQVRVRSKDELGILAGSFNLMSTALARSNSLRRKMTADIAHDLRTPLSVILGYTEALRDKKLEPTQEMYTVMHTEAQHLSHLIDDLKILALADAGELPLNFQEIPPGELMKRSADAYRITADRAQIALRTEIAPDLPKIRIDEERMAQVIGNLMSNAFRYTPAGGEIVLSADRSGGKVRLRVADSGPGIAAEDLPFIFERSFRGDKARRQQAAETGLGLAIAKSLVEAQDGTITAESSLGEGTVFSILLPAV